MPTYTASTAVIPNPERGWFLYAETHNGKSGTSPNLLSSSDVSAARTGTQTIGGSTFTARTLVFRYYFLEQYISSDLDQDYLDRLATDLLAVRNAGAKIILRFAYNDVQSSGDATPAQVQRHITQLAPVINYYADVVHAVEAGFIGTWGEWYYSSNFGDQGNLSSQNIADRNAVISSLLTKLDSRIFVLLRYVGSRQTYLNSSQPNPGGDATRLGLHNDAFLANYGDYGTYTTFTSQSESYNRTYLANMANLPVGGESATATDSPGTDYASAQSELIARKWSFINPNYHPDVLSKWSQAQKDTVAKNLGYRLRLTTSTIPSNVTAGASSNVQFTIVNDGWNAPVRNRPVNLVLDDGNGNVYTFAASVDIRNWGPGSSTNVTIPFTVPNKAGTYSTYLTLPDASSTIANNPLYNIQLANTGVWSDSTGRNNLGQSMVISGTSTPTYSANATLGGNGALTSSATSGSNTSGNTTITDNGDGTSQATNYTDNGDGTSVTTGITDNGDGTSKIGNTSTPGPVSYNASVGLSGSGSLNVQFTTSSGGGGEGTTNQRTNLFTNPHAVAGGAAYSSQTPNGPGKTLTYDATGASDGGSAFVLTLPSSYTGDTDIRISIPFDPSLVVTGGSKLTMAADIYVPVAGFSGAFSGAFPVSNNNVAYPSGTLTTLNVGWNRIVNVVTVPSDTTGTVYDLQFYTQAAPPNYSPAPNSSVWKLSRAILERATSDGNYFDGNSPNATWSGATNNSTSTVNSKPAYSSTLNLTGNGSLTSTAVTRTNTAANVNLNLSGAGTLAANGVRGSNRINVSVPLTGTGSLNTNNSRGQFGTASLGGNGALSLSVKPGFPSGAIFYGTGELSVQGYVKDFSSQANLQGQGSLNAYGRGGQVGVPAPGVLQIRNNRNITGYSVEENATPINAASTEGGVGTIQFGYPQRDDWLMLYEQDVQLDDDYRGTTSGKISNITAENGILSLTADNRLVTLIGDTFARPMSGTFESVARYYLSLGQITSGIYFHSDVADIPVTVQGWAGDAWLNLKQLCTAYNVEVSLVSNNIAFRPIRSLTINPRRLVSLNEQIATADLAHSVEVNYFTNYWYSGVMVYPRTTDERKDAQVFQVDANAVIEDDIQLTVSLESILQPVCVTDVAQDYDGTQSVYSVRGVDNSQVTPQQWAASGGKIELSINDDTTSVHIKITGPRDEYYSPYRIAGRVKEVTDPTKIINPPGSPALNQDDNKDASKGSANSKPKKETAKQKAARLKKEAQEAAKKKAEDEAAANKEFADPASSEQDYPSLRIVGTGAFIDKATLKLPTGVPAERTAADVGATVDSVYVNALEDAYRVGVQVAAAYRGEEHSLTASLTQINQRMGSGSVLYRTVGDFENQYRGQTIGQFEQQWTGKTIADFNAAQRALVVDNFNNQVFGNVPGTRFKHNNAMFRITDATTTESDVGITAVRDTLFAEFKSAHAGQKVADFNRIYAGKTLKEFGRVPLLGGS